MLRLAVHSRKSATLEGCVTRGWFCIMSSTTCWLSIVVFLLPVWAHAEEETPLAREINAILSRTEYRQARWGLLLVEAESGKTLYEHNADQLFAPASVTKLYSCAAAQIGLGAEWRFETPVYRRGEVKEGKLQGDLILVARGDLTLGGRTTKEGKMAFADDDHIYSAPSKVSTRLTSTDPLAGLSDLARQVKQAGIREITGEVLIDARLFEPARGSGSGPGLLTPVLVNDNIVDVVVKPAEKPGLLASYELVPRTEFVQIDVQVRTVEKKQPVNIITRRVGPQRYTVRGQIPVGMRPQVRICAVDDPVAFARALFIDCLRREGIWVSTSALREPVVELPEASLYGKWTPVALHRSLPLSEALKVTLKVSHNLYASTLPLLLAVKHEKRTLAEGMRVQGKILSELGVATQNISLESGAGGGDGDKVSPRVTVQLLQRMRQRSDWPVFEAALPVLGVDGTLADVIAKDSPARGKVKAKTGTYTDSNLVLGRSHLRAKSLAGVLTTAKGKTLLFAFFVNDVLLPRGVTSIREGRILGKLCEIVYQHAD